MFDQPRFHREALVPLVAGLLWLWLGAHVGFWSFLVCCVPGVPLTASGAAKLLWPGDRRIQQFAAVGGVAGFVLAIPGLWYMGLVPGLVAGGLSMASVLAAGAVSVRQEPHFEGVPRPVPSLALAAKVGADETILGFMQTSLPTLGRGRLQQVKREVDTTRELFRDRGWLEKPEGYHEAPLPLDAPELRERSTRTRGGIVHYEHLSFESEYEPRPEEPGRDRWLSYSRNRTAHAWVMRHRDDEDRPWIVGIHGYQMGFAHVDFGAFDPEFFHRKMGLNVLLPVLPLHGPRRIGRISGVGFLSGHPLDSIHGVTQAIWDLRRMLSWVRARGGGPVGVMGLSLGGYHTAVAASLIDGLSCAIPGIPATDFARLTWRHGPSLQVQMMEHRGIVHDEVAEIYRVISPLVLEPKVPHERRAIYAGVADRLVPPDQVLDLWRHWEEPEIVWYQGSHISFMFEPGVKPLIRRNLEGAGLVHA